MKIFGIIGWKNSGKTGLMERLVSEITARGYSVSTLKHAHHSFDVDQEGKDSFRHREAGAREVLLSSRNRWALMHELRGVAEPTLAELLERVSPCDLLLVEGFKNENHAKLEANLAVTGQPLIAPNDRYIRAVASDQSFEELSVPVFDINNTNSVADFVLHECGLVSEIEPLAANLNSDSPELANDCFALPEGVDWVPVDDALSLLRENLSTVVGCDEVLATDAQMRVLASDHTAKRSNPPAANSAIDGYGFANSSTGDGPQVMPLLEGRSAAGEPYGAEVPNGYALRILTGALLPRGVDTVVMQEDVKCADGQVSFNGPVKAGLNTRRAGEDVTAGQVALSAGHCLRAPDLALLTGLGIANVSVHSRLRVGVLSTGDEIVAADGGKAKNHQTYDANRPMLLSLAERWGYAPVDLGHVIDDRAKLAARLNDAVKNVDVILTSGGASAGEEDHVSALLKEQGTLHAWRIALKPGRPLALAVWQGVPVFGLPGNPVAALVCALIFARPSLSVLSGAGWRAPQGFMVPAAFEKTKKPGRREYLRARMNADGHVEVFPSEGSGRISGLSWAQGLVELGDEAQTVKQGDLVRFLPYASFGI